MSIGESYGTPATYNGQYFDSQTEAAWAAYFDVVGMEYEREPECFQLDKNTLYTPDFYLPDQNTYVEVKNGNADWEACYKIAQLARRSGHPAMLLDGMPRNMAAYFFSPDSRNLADSDLWPQKEYADFALYKPSVYLASQGGSSPFARIIRDAIVEADQRWEIHVPPNIAAEALTRRRQMNAQPTDLPAVY